VTDHLDAPALEAGLPDILASPADAGMVRLVVRRPRVNAREVLEEGVLDVEEGLVGDGWVKRRSRWGPPNPRKQLTVMNARVAALVARGLNARVVSGGTVRAGDVVRKVEPSRQP
jgi:hypothetical protein